MSLFRIGFLPLVDACLPIVAREFGHAQAEGLTVELVRDRTWAAVRDRLSSGHTDAAHLVAPLAIAMTLGLDRPPVPIAAPFMLCLNGNTITTSSTLAAEIGMGLHDDIADLGLRLAQVAKAHKALGRKLRFAVVHRYSSHNYMLRYWLAACGCDPDRDIDITVVPPPLIADAFAAGEIDGSCVGEPWNSLAVENGDGAIITTTSRIWSRGVEKILALRTAVLEERRAETEALLRALYAAGRFAKNPAHRAEVTALLARPEYIGVPAPIIERALSGHLVAQAGSEAVKVPDFLVLHKEAANFPWRSQAMWLYSQMARWGHAPASAEGFAKAATIFRPDVYRAAFAGTDAALPGASAKVEGAIAAPLAIGSPSGRLVLGPDRFFDGRQFDPDQPMEYLAQNLKKP